jgi:spore coat polysaccharide biosynthesis predicted glycosyltransferase SpsG
LEHAGTEVQAAIFESMNTRRVLFRVEGNDQVGHGHFIRCLTMARYLKDELTCEFAMSNPSRLALQELESHQLNWHKTPAKEQFHPDDPKSTEPWSFDLQGLLQPFDLLIMDGYRFDDTFIHASRETGAKVIQVLDFFDKPIHADAVITQIPITENEIPKSVPLWSGNDGYLIRPEFYDRCEASEHHDFDVFIYMSSIASLKTYDDVSFLHGKKICALTRAELRDECENRGWVSSVSPKTADLIFLMRRSASAILPASTIAIEYYVATGRVPRVMALAQNQQWSLRKFTNLGIWRLHGSQESSDDAPKIGEHVIENPGKSFLNWMHGRF